MTIPAACYLRMSTEHQKYSLENQSARIGMYAQDHGFEIVKRFKDVAKSGLLLRNRTALQALLQEVVSHRAQFKAILVLDVSRWGRFQDIDESAHYEFLCKQAGIPVHYCGESFSTEITLANMILKTLKRSMAAEYSRELSAKVATASRRIAALGFRNGGIAGYGYRRMMVNANRQPKLLLERGQRKATAADRVILVPGPPNEVACVRQIYRMFVEHGYSTARIADQLNRNGTPYLNGKPWRQAAVYRILTHPKYCGSHVFGQRSQILKGRNITKPRSSWCVVPNAFEGLVTHETFDKVQSIIRVRTPVRTDEDVLNALKEVWRREGKLNQKVIAKSKNVPSTGTYWRRFGGLRNAYQRIGYHGCQSSPLINSARKKMRDIRQSLLNSIVAGFPGQVWSARKNWRERFRLRLKNNSIITVYVCRSHTNADGSLRWYLDTSRCETCRFSLIARLDETNSQFLDFHLLPCIRRATRFTLTRDDQRLLAGSRFTDIRNFLIAAESCLDLL